MAIQISGCPVIDNSRCLTNIANATSSAATANSFAIRDSCGFILANNFSFVLSAATPLGSFSNGGFLICKGASNGFIVSPSTTEVSRSWHLRDDANTVANACTGCTGWFVPTAAQLQNPGYCCRTFWDAFSTTPYWSSTEHNASHACYVLFTNGNAARYGKNCSCCVRAFRCVTY